MPFRAALSGIQSASKELKMIGNNVANASTTGFKKSRAQFADVYAASDIGSSSNTIGSGVRIAAVTQQFSQGNVDFTDNNLDMAINGGGFFMLEKNGERVYSRAGAIEIDREGFMVNSDNLKLLGKKADENGNPIGETGPISLDNANVEPKSTNIVTVGVNLDSSEKKPLFGPFDPNDAGSFNHSTSLTVFDSLGTSHQSTVYFVKGESPNQWTVHTFIDGKDVNGSDAPPYASNELMFNGSGGLASIDGTAVPPGRIEYPEFVTDTGSNPVQITLDFLSSTPTTQFGAKFTVNALTQDGFATGRLTSLDIDESGIVRARYTNGQTRTLGQIQLSDFPNVQGLRQLGDSTWAESFESGIPLLGTPGSGSLGLIQSGALEGSNVDLTEQLINMISAQRNFQANAQVITTADAVTQSVINIR
ncbi:MAG: flagellar hook protein FlgE [Gammaproteobacteria bacterium]